MPLVTWKEKLNSLRSNFGVESKNATTQSELVLALDIVTQFMSLDQRFANQNLVDSLKKLLLQTI